MKQQTKLYRSIIGGMLIFGTLITLLPTRAFACLCDMPSIKKAFQRSDGVFVGTVLDGIIDNTVTLSVDKTFKGSLETLTTIQIGDTSCDPVFPEFEKNKRYLVYAQSNEDGNLSVGACSRTGSFPNKYLDDFNILTKGNTKWFYGEYDRYIESVIIKYYRWLL
jgi:hypothetical protein